MSIQVEIQRELHAKALRDSLWLVLFHAQILGESYIQAQVTTIIALVDGLRQGTGTAS